MKHTSGPWVAVPLAEPRGARNGCFSVTGSISGGLNPVAVLFPHARGDSVNPANAALIAAAPDLLAALVAARGMLETASRYFPKSIRNADRFSLQNVLANTVNPAIARAEGGEG